MKPETELKIMRLCKGMKLKEVEYRLDVMTAFIKQKKNMRINFV